MYKQIKKIEYIGIENVYDLTIKDNHNYVGNNMVIHNCGYRGDLGVIIFNHSDKPYVVTQGDRIGQLIISPISQFEFEEVQELNNTIRGDNGFGSTGN